MLAALATFLGISTGRVEITEAEALDSLSQGFQWEYTHPGFLTFTLPDGRTVELEGGFPPARWYVPKPP